MIGVDNLNDYYDVRLKDYRLGKLLGAGSKKLGADPKRSIYALNSQPSALSSGNFTFYHLDIENLPALEALFTAHKFDAVFNLAARAGVRYSLEYPELYRRTNILGEENVLKCQVKYGVRKHVLASSSSVYAGCPTPFAEDAKLGKMQSPYAETKYQAELLAKRYHDEHGLDVTVLRYFTVFGPAGRPDMAPFRFIKWIDEGSPITLYGDGSQARDFTYIDDIARGTILAGQSFGGKLTQSSEDAKMTGNYQSSAPSTQFQAASCDIINLGGGNNPLSITAMIDTIERALGKKAQIDLRPASAADMRETWADIAKAKRLLGWAPEMRPADGFCNAVAWHNANREWLKDIRL